MGERRAEYKDKKRTTQPPIFERCRPPSAGQFENLGIYTVEDLLRHYPRRYELRIRRRIAELVDGELATITGFVSGSQISRGRIQVVKLNIEQGAEVFMPCGLIRFISLNNFPLEQKYR
jgi:RecG-like helicase